jgi:hypothetical protein
LLELYPRLLSRGRSRLTRVRPRFHQPPSPNTPLTSSGPPLTGLEVCISTVNYGELRPSLGHGKCSFRDVLLSGRYARFGDGNVPRPKQRSRPRGLRQSETSLPRSSLRPPTRSRIATTIMPRIAQARMQISVVVIAPSPGHVGPNRIDSKLTGTRWPSQIVSTVIHCGGSNGADRREPISLRSPVTAFHTCGVAWWGQPRSGRDFSWPLISSRKKTIR